MISESKMNLKLVRDEVINLKNNTIKLVRDECATYLSKKMKTANYRFSDELYEIVMNSASKKEIIDKINSVNYSEFPNIDYLRKSICRSRMYYEELLTFIEHHCFPKSVYEEFFLVELMEIFEAEINNL